jgi:DNA invertase Pin-like site-specific DNA recombinase
MNVVGYIRVSTEEQGDSRAGLEGAQVPLTGRTSAAIRPLSAVAGTRRASRG